MRGVRCRLVILAVGLCCLAAGCGSGAGGGGSPSGSSGGGSDRTTGAGAVPVPEVTVTAKDFRWSDPHLVLEASDSTLMVVNADSERHSFTARQLGVDVDIEGGSSTRVQFDPYGRTGQVDFLCRFHPSMTGRIQFVIT